MEQSLIHIHPYKKMFMFLKLYSSGLHTVLEFVSDKLKHNRKFVLWQCNLSIVLTAKQLRREPIVTN